MHGNNKTRATVCRAFGFFALIFWCVKCVLTSKINDAWTHFALKCSTKLQIRISHNFAEMSHNWTEANYGNFAHPYLR